MRRIRIASGQLRDVHWSPGQHVRLTVTPPTRWLRDPRDARRSYSVWHLDREHGNLDLCVLDHGEGPGAQWAKTAYVGRPVTMSRPEGRLTLREAPYHLFAGDETAAVAFGAMLRALPADAAVHGVLETDAPDGEVPLPRPHRLPWIHRGDDDADAETENARPAAAERTPLVEAVRALRLPRRPGIAYLAGHASDCQAVQRHLLHERGWSRRDIVVKPFWAPGKRGLE
ncbi:siderophore-interacting protein [Actinomadura sp. HBU206391]|nr:siderophore-interacting protein [Actinomadura sp. HBU206391]